MSSCRLGAVAVCLAISSMGFLSLPTAHGDVVNLVPLKDNTLYQVSGTPMSNGAGQRMFSGRTAQGERRRALIQFDIAGTIPAGSTITSVQLSAYMSKTTSVAQNIALRKLLASWGEGASDSDAIQGGGQGAPAQPGDATWVNRFHPGTPWSPAGGQFAATASGTTLVDYVGLYTWNSTAAMVADVQGWLDAPTNNFGWALIGNEAINGTVKRFDTREVEAPGTPPHLVVTFTAPPPTCACVADMNADSLHDGGDIAGFVACLLGGGVNCGCADMNGGGLDVSDIEDFVSLILLGADCQ